MTELDRFYNEEIKTFEEEKYEIPYTTMNVGVINGGSATNSVSASCNVSIDFRIANKVHINTIKEKIEKLAKKYDCEINIIECVEPFIDESKLVSETKTANFITEASLMKGSDRIILGPGPVTAHEVNECITEESYDQLLEQYKELIVKVCCNLSKIVILK